MSVPFRILRDAGEEANRQEIGPWMKQHDTAPRLVLVEFGIVAIFSVGMLLPRALRRASERDGVLAIGGGAPLAVGLLGLWLVSSQPVAVRCFPRGSMVSTRLWWGGSLGGGSATGMMTPEGTTSRLFVVGAQTYRYRCQSGELVAFEGD